jgi:hypothetical protein
MPPPIAELCLFPAKIYSNAYNTTLSEPLPGCLHPSLSPPWCLTVYNAPKIQTPHQSLRIRVEGMFHDDVPFREPDVQTNGEKQKRDVGSLVPSRFMTKYYFRQHAYATHRTDANTRTTRACAKQGLIRGRTRGQSAEFREQPKTFSTVWKKCFHTVENFWRKGARRPYFFHTVENSRKTFP